MSSRFGRHVGLLCVLSLPACDSTRPSVRHQDETGDTAGKSSATAVDGGVGAGGSNAPGSAGAAGSSDPANAGRAGAAGASSGACNLDGLADLNLFSPSWDALGYPPYAIEACTLVYVAAEDGGGALRLRNLATGEDLLLEAAANHPRRPTLSSGVIAWERDGAGGSEVSVVTTTPARTRHFEQAGEPRAAWNAVVFTRFLGAGPTDDTDVMLYDVDQDVVAPMGTGAAQQRFADISTTHVAFTDFSEDAKGYFDPGGSISDIVVVERESGQLTVRGAPGKQAFPLLGHSGVLAYLDWGAVHPEPKFSQFHLKAGNVNEPVSADVNVKPDGLVSADPAYARPSLNGLYLDFVDRPSQAPQLYRVTLGSGTAPTPVPIANATRLFGPVATASLTLVARQGQDQSLSLVAIVR
ncbi:MAG TPA: hypothetical protein VJN18_03400 [Polyangiaceae bacterium]|nr:hypothetical protein [Polyangiaceae bacterium]